jgi:hypothetical protein
MVFWLSTTGAPAFVVSFVDSFFFASFIKTSSKFDLGLHYGCRYFSNGNGLLFNSKFSHAFADVADLYT